MGRSRIVVVLTCSLLAASSYSLKADVRADEKSHVELAGALGKIVNIFGGKAAREGTTSTVAVKGDRKSSLNESAGTGQIIDLAEEKVYDLDLKHKSYKVTTFDELRRRMEEAQKRAQENAAKQPQTAPQPAAAPDKNQKQMDVDFSLKETGQKKIVNGFDTHEVVMTITLREKGKTIDQSGGMILTSDMWMGARIPAMREIPEFDMRYWQKLHGTAMAGASAEDMAAAMAMYPMMKDAVSRMNSENVKMDGTAIQTVTTLDSVKSAEEMAQAQQNTEESKPAPAPTGLGGLLAKKMMQKKQAQAAQSDSPNRATFMTTTTEVLKVTTDVGAGDVAIPAGFKESK